VTAMNRRFPADVYTAVHGRDLRRVAAAFEPEACGRVLGRSKVAGDYHGPAGMAESFDRMLTLSEGTLRYHVHSLQANEHHGPVLLRVRARRGEQTLDLSEVHLFYLYALEHGPVFTLWIRPFAPTRSTGSGHDERHDAYRPPLLRRSRASRLEDAEPGAGPRRGLTSPGNKSAGRLRRGVRHVIAWLKEMHDRTNGTLLLGLHDFTADGDYAGTPASGSTRVAWMKFA